MWPLLPVLLFHILSISSIRSWEHRFNRQHRAEKIAQSRTHPRNATPVPFGPRPYQAPFYCKPAHLVIPGDYIVTLAPFYSLTQHLKAFGEDVRNLVVDSVSASGNFPPNRLFYQKNHRE